MVAPESRFAVPNNVAARQLNHRLKPDQTESVTVAAINHDVQRQVNPVAWCVKTTTVFAMPACPIKL